MADALRAAGMRVEFIDAVDLHLVEMSPVLRQAQSRTLTDYQPTWHDGFRTVPDGPLIVVANEFFDALPVHQYQRVGDGWRERMVTVVGDALAFTLAPDPVPDAALPQNAANDGDIVEVALASDAVMQSVSERIVRHGGCALIVDYGHAKPGIGDTLQAVRGHAYAPVLQAVGEADLTVHVDFEALSRSAATAGAVAHGPVTQGAFLERLGIAARAAQLRAGATAAQQQDIDMALNRLTARDQMGTLFKALAVSSPGITPPGFQEAA
jgi:NADH dehydrogenase [ubiquinone] 1 alpha subcomplex assembly factor 7